MLTIEQMRNQGDFKNLYFPTLVNWEKIVSTTLTYMHETQFFSFFFKWEN